MRSAELKRLKYEDFPIRLFYKLLSKPTEVAERFVGAGKWQTLLQKWEEDDDSLESDRLLEDQKKVALPLMKAQKAAVALRWVLSTSMDREAVLTENGLPYKEDLMEQIEVLENFITKNKAQYENNLIQLEATKLQQAGREPKTRFSADDAIATLNLAGFTIMDPNRLTIGQYQAMNRTIQRNNGKRAS